MLKNLVIGAGSMGLILQYLIQESEESHLLARDSSCAALLDKPLEVTGAVEGSLNIQCYSWSKFPQLSDDAAIFVATKAHEIPVVLQNLAPHIKSSNKIVLMQNGLGIYEMAKQILPDNSLFRLLCYIGVRKVSPCHIHVAGIHKYEFAGEQVHADFLNKWQKVLLDKGIDTTVNFNPLKSEWQKALWNLSINGLCSIVDEPNGAIADSPELNNLARQVVLEAVEIAQLEGIHLTTEHLEDVFKSLERTRENINATLQDLRAGRHPELEFLNGAVAKIAAKHGRRAPLNEAIFNLVTFLEKAEKRKEIEDGRSGTKG
ncbi:MAG: ketopantoate reductase family protein [Candidatus Obscuribacterales bacterium]|nr:ketopantoate reductase family protein [Candidatus Obscuribacterales bacterium]